MNALVQTYCMSMDFMPQAVQLTGAESLMNLAARAYLLRHFPDGPDGRWDKSATIFYVEHDLTFELQWAVRSGCPWHPETTSAMIRTGHWDLLEWSLENGCRWHDSAMRELATYCDPERVQWAVDHGCPWDGSAVLKGAASAGKWTLFRWAVRFDYLPETRFDLGHVYNVPEDKFPMVKASRAYVRRFLLQGIDEDVYDDDEDDDFLSNPYMPATRAYASENLIRALQWAVKNHYDCHPETTLAACKAGHWDLLQWAVRNGVTWHPDACVAIAEHGNLEMMKWAVRNGATWHPDVTLAVARSGNLDAFKWAVEYSSSYVWHTDITRVAAEEGHVHILEWAVAQGCPWHVDATIAAATSGQLLALSWLVSAGCPWNPRTIEAAKEVHLDLEEWARSVGVSSKMQHAWYEDDFLA